MGQIRTWQPVQNSAPIRRRLVEKLLKTVLFHQNDHQWPKNRKVAWLYFRCDHFEGHMSHILRTAEKKTREVPSTHLSVVNCASAGTLPAEAESLRPLQGKLNKGTAMVFTYEKWLSCSPAKLCQKHEHQSQKMMGVDGESGVLSGAVALPHEKSTIEDKRTPVLQKVHHSFTYHPLPSIHHRPTVIGNSLSPVRLPPQLPQEMRRTLQDASNSSLHDSRLRERPYCFSHS